MRAKSAPPPQVDPPLPPPAKPPPAKKTQEASSSSSAYPTLNKEKAKERVGGNIRVKQPQPTGAAAAADEYEEPIADGMFDIAPSRIGIQVLFEIFENAINKGKLSSNNIRKYREAIREWDQGVLNRSQKKKDEAKNELKEMYKNLFFKKPKF